MFAATSLQVLCPGVELAGTSKVALSSMGAGKGWQEGVLVVGCTLGVGGIGRGLLLCILASLLIGPALC